ncbi:cyclophilin-like fold protein [Breznakia pachnodae]|uniref:Cyclophilin-like domain-containing protein n=1 Tax=Breznakia pachnodae TaxID=265178 RepID=A0ABU0E4Y1_9FIRM|nr:cyclophilin-like fold protein [Breznakia pachnodae]MDQ0361968.1 hypothetical protein [Breznakia pachnodae]
MKGVKILITLMMSFLISSCSNQNTSLVENEKAEEAETSKELISIVVEIDSVEFTAKLYDNDATKEFIQLFPLTIVMDDLNNNEKKYDLNIDLSMMDTTRPQKMESGEIMYWSNRTLVVFYESFDNAYGGYIKLGYVEDIDSFSTLLRENPTVTITFKLD